MNALKVTLKNILALISLLLLSPLGFAQSSKPTPFFAQYQATSKGLPCGGGWQRLFKEAQHYRLQSQGDFCLFGGEVDSDVVLQWQRTRWQSTSFEASVKRWFRHDQYQGKNPTGTQMLVFKEGELLDDPEFAPATQDPATMIQNLGLAISEQQQDLFTDYTWGDETRHYPFEWLGDDTIEFDGKPYAAYHLRQTHPKKSRVADFWFAPALNHQLIQMTVHRLGIKVLHVELTEFSAASH